MEKNEKIAELFNDEAFMNSLDEIDSMAGLQKALADRGVEMTIEEVEKMSKELVVVGKSGELDPTQLEAVSGGAGISDFVKWAKKGWSYGAKFCDWMYKTFGVV